MLYISPPFGNWIHTKNTTSILGTFTYMPICGRFRKAYQSIRHVNGGWINQIGLANGGIKTLPWNRHNDVISLYGHTYLEWDNLYRYLSYSRYTDIELNLSCPNIVETTTQDIYKICKLFNLDYRVVVKLPPIGYLSIFDQAYNAGVKIFHCCNSYPSLVGGISGKPLISYSLKVIEHLKLIDTNLIIIGGGGITSIADIKTYRNAGADHFSISTALFNPLTYFTVNKLAMEGK